MMTLAQRFIRNEAASTTVEYAVLLVFIFLACYVALIAMGVIFAALIHSAQMHLIPNSP
jgi:Flp pilus assembly pilin Flp